MEQILAIVHLLAVAPFPACLAYAGLCDLRTMKIPNWVSLALFGAFVPAAITAGWNGEAVLNHVLAGAAMLVAGIILFVTRIFGGGDAKLLAAATVWVGWAALPAYLFLVAISGGVLGLTLLVFRRLRLPSRLAAIAWVRRLHSEVDTIPYGIAIAAGGIILFPQLSIIARPAGY